MLINLSSSVLDTIEKASKLSIEQNIPTPGTEYLLYVMYQNPNSICHFILSEYDVDLDELEMKDSYIIRSIGTKYTKKLEEVIERSKEIAKSFKSETVMDEHFFLSMLEVKETICESILKDINIDIEDCKRDVYDIFNVCVTEDNPYIKSLTEKVKKGEISPFIGRREYLDRMDVIIKRRNKNNPLLIGSAGVGKTALVEGLAYYYQERKEDYEIYALDLSSCLAGAKYRGDFEDRILSVIKEIKKNPKAILFIDEVHNLVGAGSSEGSMDAANILKPILARGEIKVIGATTYQEYHKHIEKDKALSRRFQSVMVTEPSIQETLEILKGIKGYYESFHHQTLSDELLPYLVEESFYRIPNRYFPDKAIDILDETLTMGQLQKKTIDIEFINQVIDNNLGIKVDLSSLRPELKKYALLKKAHIERKTSLNILYQGGTEELESLLTELTCGFGLSKEMILRLDMEDYQSDFERTVLLGSPPGYVGYEEGGILSSHLEKYMEAIICVSSFEKGVGAVKELILKMMRSGKIMDNQGRSFDLKGVVFLIHNNKVSNSIGFIEEKKKGFKFDIEITGHDDYYLPLRKKLFDLGYKVEIEKGITGELLSYLGDLLLNYPKGNYRIERETGIVGK